MVKNIIIKFVLNFKIDVFDYKLLYSKIWIENFWFKIWMFFKYLYRVFYIKEVNMVKNVYDYLVILIVMWCVIVFNKYVLLFLKI